MLKRLYLLMTLIGVVPSSMMAQVKPFSIQYSFRHGAYLYFTDRALAPDAPFDNRVAVRVSRNTGSGFKALATVSRPSNFAAFKKISGEEVWSQLKLMKNLSSDEALWKYIVSHPLINDYGMMAFSMEFRQAMGSALLDKEAAGLASGKKWFYKIEWLDAQGKTVGTSEGSITGGEQLLSLEKAKTKSSFATDSTVHVGWYVIPRTKTESIIMADIFRQEGGKGAYKKLPVSVLASMQGDSLTFSYHDKVKPQTLYRYFIKPTDNLGNSAQPSDTINILSYDFASLPLVENVTIKDTVNSIEVRWKPLGDVPHLVGIEIQRSRDVRGNYVVIDTVATAQHTFIDTKVFPGIPYYYRLRVIGLQGKERETGYSGYGSAVVKNRLKNPDPPYNLTGELEKGNVKLTWQPVSDPDLYAYFVYRSTSEQGKFEVISSSITTTEFTDTSAISGRTQYVYAVKAVNNNSMESEFSNTITLRQSVATLPQAPSGVSAYVKDRTVVLNWPSVTRTDNAVAGYTIYRREAQPTNAFDLKVSAAAQADNLKFVLLNSNLNVQPYFEDQQAIAGKTYEYAIASVDVFGMESTFSPFAKITLDVPSRIITNCTVRKISTGVELSWDTSLSEGSDAVTIYRKKAGDATYQKLIELNKGQQNYIDKTASKGTLYIYVISAEKNKYTMAKSEEKNIRF